MPTFAGPKYRLGLIRDATTRRLVDLEAHPRGGAGLFDVLGPLVPGLPAPPADLLAAAQPEAGRAVLIESSEPEVARTLYTFAALLRAARVAEVGVFRGYTSQFLAAALPDGGELHLVDLSADALAEASGRAARPGVAVRTHRGLSTDPAVLAAVPDGCDLVYLDADHSGDGVLAELRAWAPKVRPGGLVAVHDTVNVRGVCRAVNRFADATGAAVLTVATGRGSGLTVLRPAAS